MQQTLQEIQLGLQVIAVILIPMLVWGFKMTIDINNLRSDLKNEIRQREELSNNVARMGEKIETIDKRTERMDFKLERLLEQGGQSPQHPPRRT